MHKTRCSALYAILSDFSLELISTLGLGTCRRLGYRTAWDLVKSVLTLYTYFCITNRFPKTLYSTGVAIMANTTVNLQRNPPIDRKVLDRFRKPLRIGFGASVVGFCAASTIEGVHSWVVAAHGPIIAWALGGVAALIIFLVQLYTGEDVDLLPFYLFAYVPDTYFTYNWVDWLLGGIIRANGGNEAAAILVSVIVAMVSAWVGERALFGKRRRSTRDANANSKHTSDNRRTIATRADGSL